MTPPPTSVGSSTSSSTSVTTGHTSHVTGEPRRARRPFGAAYRPADLPDPFAARVGRALTRWGLRLLYDAEYHGTRNIPREGGAILVGNHPTISDPFVVAFGTQRWVTWLAFKDALAWPIAGDIMRLYRAIPIDLDRAAPSALKAAYATLARGRILGLFFEGERSFTDALNSPLKVGAARMAIKAGVPLVPLTVSGARRCWPREWSAPRRGKVIIRYHAPIDAKAYRPELPLRERGRLLTEDLARIIGGSLPPRGAPRFHSTRARPDPGPAPPGPARARPAVEEAP